MEIKIVDKKVELVKTDFDYWIYFENGYIAKVEEFRKTNTNEVIFGYPNNKYREYFYILDEDNKEYVTYQLTLKFPDIYECVLHTTELVF